jgi:hypothetical protein
MIALAVALVAGVAFGVGLGLLVRPRREALYSVRAVRYRRLPEAIRAGGRVVDRDEVEIAVALDVTLLDAVRVVAAETAPVRRIVDSDGEIVAEIVAVAS